MLGGVLLVGALPAGAAGAGTAAHEKRGDCGSNAFYDAEVENDDGGLEGNFEIDGANPGEKWRVQVKHNGDRFLNETRAVDREREIDVEWFRDDSPGADTFKIKATEVNGPAKCSVTIRR